ncbi:unnamed protein product [Allacma fusca]|uniref:CTCK domain-containing protein n=1 Tax=Allacma fusca TaxID=39272 RepID=A0A8J2PJS7_9HEXA|nr:unnamed protein product [Allacma fusca]
MIAQSSSSSSAIFDGGESQTQIVQKGLTEKLNVDSVDSVSGDYSDCYSTSSLASSSSSSITRCDLSEKKCGCSRGALWITCALVSVILIVVVALTLTLTLMSVSSSPDGVNSLNINHNDDPTASEAYSLEFPDDSSNPYPNQYDSVNYVETVYTDEPRSNQRNTAATITGDDAGRTLELNVDTLSGKRTNKSQQKLAKADLKKLSRQSWEFLNRKPSSQKPNSNFISKSKLRNSDSVRPGVLSNNAEDDANHGGVVLPALMVYTSDGEASNGQVSNLFSLKTNNMSKKSCCRTQKYIQTVKLDGCEPLKIVNRMCSGRCVSVWIPGVFSSFPVCQPSRSHWKVVTLKCGLNRDKKKRVRIEKVRRCSCMEVTNSSPN